MGIGSANPLLLATAASGGDSGSSDPVTRSLRFNDAGDSHLYFDPTATHDSSTVYTFSCWAKLGEMDAESYEIFTAGYYASGGADQNLIYFGHNADSKMRVWIRSTADSTNTTYTSTAVFRDPSAWYHLLLVRNGASLKVYVNNSEVISETISSTQRYGVGNGYPMHIGSSLKPTSSSLSNYSSFDGLLADVYFTDGYAKAPTDFIELGDYGNYIPKAYTGEFGTNGFHIDAQPAHDADLLVSSIDRNDGDTLFADAAAGHTITTNGNTEHSIAVGNPFTSTGRSIDFGTNTGNYLKIWDGSTGDYNLGSDDFTMEAWYNTNDTKSYMTLFSHYQDANNWFVLYVYTNDYLYWYWETGGSYIQIPSNVQWQHHKWNHVAVTKSGTTHKLWLNGVQVATGTKGGSHTFTSTNPMYLGTLQGFGSSYHGDGYVYDARISSSIRYTSDFDVPTEKFTDDSDTELLLQPDNSDSDWDDVDKSHNSHGVTEYGTVTRTASSPYEAAAKSTAIHFDGSGDYLQTSTSSDLTFGTGDFTVETWFYPTTVNTSTAYKGIISDELYSSTGGWALSQRDDELSLWIKNTGGSWVSFVADGALTANQWQHIAVSYDSSTTTTRLFVDGTVVASGTTSGWNLTGDQVEIGRSVSGQEIAGYVFDVRATKGTARYTSNFTAPSAPFELNPVYIGGDQSGNKNHFTPTNISITHDVMLDVPTKNYATLNPLDAGGGTFSEGNLKWAAGGSHRAVRFTQAALAGDKTYFEVYFPDSWSNQPMIGLMGAEAKISDHQNANPSLWFRSNGYEYNNGSESNASNPTWTNGDIVGVAVDLSAGELKYRVNNGSFTTAFTGLSSSTTWIPAIKGYDTSPSYILNTGGDPSFAGNKTSGQDTSQGEFYYAPPNDSDGNPFKSLNTSNLDDPTVTPTEHFDILTYTGNSDLYNASGSTQNVTGVNFDVGMAWIKDRDNNSSGYTSSGYDEYGHYLFDTVTGTSSGGYNLDADVVSSGSGTTLNSGYYGVTSFSAGSGTNRGITVDEAGETNFDYDDGYYQLTERYVAWLWKLGSTGSSSTWNSSYTAPSTEHYNDLAGVTAIEVSPVSSGNLEVAHSLSDAPEFFFVGHDSYPNFTGYPAFHKDLTSGYYLQLDGSAAQSSDSTYFPSGAAHADYIKLGSVFADSYGYGGNLRIWAFTGVEGYSRFGKYTGNGSTDGVFVYTGFRPRFLMVKRLNSSAPWKIRDAARDPYNVASKNLDADSSGSEGDYTSNNIDLLSNGFKWRTSGSHENHNGHDYIYAAFAEQPFAAPSNAR